MESLYIMAPDSGYDTHYDDARRDLQQKVHQYVSANRYEPVSGVKRKPKMLPSLFPLQKFLSRSLTVQQSVQLATPCSIKFGEGVYVNFGVKEKLIIMFMYGNKCAVFRKSDGTVAILTNAQFQGNAPAMLDGSKYGNLLSDVTFTLMYAIAKIDHCYDGGFKFSRNDVLLVLAECKGTFVGINSRKRVGIFPSELVRIITQRREYIYNGMVLRMTPAYVKQANEIHVYPIENDYTDVHEITKSSKGLFSWFKIDGREASLHELQETSVSEMRDEDHTYDTIHEVSYCGTTLQQKKRMPLPQPGQGKYSASQGVSSLRGEIWFHGNLSREKAEEVLEKDGDFLVRFMSDYPWVYVLSCKTKKGYEHFRLRLDSRSNYHTNGGNFKSIRDLVQVHQSEGKPVSKDSSTIIRTAVPNTIHEKSAQNDEEPYEVLAYPEDSGGGNATKLDHREEQSRTVEEDYIKDHSVKSLIKAFSITDSKDSGGGNATKLDHREEQSRIVEEDYIKDHSVKSLIKAFSITDSKVALTEKREAPEGDPYEKSLEEIHRANVKAIEGTGITSIGEGCFFPSQPPDSLDEITLKNIVSKDLKAILSVESTITNDGGLLKIAGTDVQLIVPAGAFKENRSECLIRLRIIPPGSHDEASVSFSSNSSTIVELLPNNLTLKLPVQLTLPHCLQLKKGTQKKVKIFMSHHEGDGQPRWEEVFDHRYILDDKQCTIWMERFCWTKYEIDDEIVEAKRIQIYTAAKPIYVPDDIAEIQVGYHLDLPGAGEILRQNPSFVVDQRIPYLFLRKGKHSLRVFLSTTLPNTWTYSTPDDNPQEIPFWSVDSSVEYMCSFILQHNSNTTKVPTCIFKASQNGYDLKLQSRPKTTKKELQFGWHKEGGRTGADIPARSSYEKVEMRKIMEEMNHLKTIVTSLQTPGVGAQSCILETYQQEVAQKRSYSKRVLQSHWEMEINEQMCYIVAEYLEPEFFHDVGRKLGVHRNRRMQIERDKTDIVERTSELLRQWHQRQGQLATIGKLIECLEPFNPEDFTFILEELCEDLDDNYSSFT